MHRKGLTLVEMLVALALTIFMMAILSEAFVTGLKAFRRLKAVADMDSQLRTAAIILRRDLQADHFDGNRRLSSYLLGTQLPDGLYDRPQQGFFCIREGATAAGLCATREDVTPDTVSRPTFYDNADNRMSDALAFTVRLTGNRPEQFFYGAVPLRRMLTSNLTPPEPPYPPDYVGQYTSRFDSISDGKFASQWAEVVYFLERDGTRATYDETTGQSLPIYKLYRTQLLLAPEVFTVPGPIAASSGEAFRRLETHAMWDDGSLVTAIEDATKFDTYFYGLDAGSGISWKHDVSAWAEQQANNNYRYRYNSPADIQFRERRFGEFAGNYIRLGGQSANPLNNQQREGADLLAVNIVSWDVKVYDPYAIKGTAINAATNPQIKYLPEFVDLGHNSAGVANLPMVTTDGVYTYAWNTDVTDPTASPPTTAAWFRTNGNNPLLPRTYDTWSNRHWTNGTVNWNYTDATTYPLPYAPPVQAVQITIRIWDEITKQTRQITIVQDM
jgi:hypothetical protein